MGHGDSAVIFKALMHLSLIVPPFKNRFASAAGSRFALHLGGRCVKLTSLNLAAERHKYSMETRITGQCERRADALDKVTGHARSAADYPAGHPLYGRNWGVLCLNP